jgi:hypothetical protein
MAYPAWRVVQPSIAVPLSFCATCGVIAVAPLGN